MDQDLEQTEGEEDVGGLPLLMLLLLTKFVLVPRMMMF